MKLLSWLNFLVILSLAAPASITIASPRAAGEELFKGQLVYVPVYSHVYYGDREQRLLLTAILSIRNTDPQHAITIVKVDYYDSDGKIIKNYLPKSITLQPMASTRFIVKESDTRGGSGAHFLVEWEAETPVNEPIMEGVMIGAAGQQGISFTSRGKAVTKK